MRPLMEYIRDFGNLTFEEKPFCDMDNIALCEAFYMDIERAAPNHFEDEPMPFDEMARKMFELNGNKNVPMGLILDKSVSEVVMAMGKTKRFSEVKVTACHAVYSVDPPIQFDAGTFILPDGTKVITYRGTDDTLVGWYEDTMIMTNKKMPSNDLAAAYLTEADEKFKDGGFIVTGHSKGGNLALYAAALLPEELMDRVAHVWDLDGPGFAPEVMSLDLIEKIDPKTTKVIPEYDVIGRIMEVKISDTKVIVSSNMGILEHNIASWCVDHGRLGLSEVQEPKENVMDATLRNWIESIPFDDRAVLIDELYEAAAASGAENLEDMAAGGIAGLEAILSKVKGFSDETKRSLAELQVAAVDAAKKKITDMPATVIDITKGLVSTLSEAIFKGKKEAEKADE